MNSVELSTVLPRARRHRQLARLCSTIAAKSCSIVSFDVFDTILWRRVPEPTDLFTVLGARLRQSGHCATWVDEAAFRAMRIEAEQAARRACGPDSSEVSLLDIWRKMPLSLFGGASEEELVRAEIDLEREFTVVDPDIADVIELVRENDIPIVLVSDTYFTEDQLSYLLDRPELEALRDARVFRSHEHGRDKASGLWRIVLRELGCSPSQIVHIGDNEVADGRVPGKMGVRTVRYQRIDEDLDRVLRRERDYTGPVCGSLVMGVDPVEGDFGFTSLRAKTVQARPAAPSAAIDTAWRYGAAVLGPVLTGFAEWVAKKACDTGTRVVWCPMREGELLSELVNNAALARGRKVEAKPLWLSRHVVSVAAFASFDPDTVREFVRRSYELTVRQLLSTLGMRPGDVPSLVNRLDDIIDNHEIASQVTRALTEYPHLERRLSATTAAARERLLRALRDSGALDHPELTMVDLGWGGTIQYYLAKVLRLAGVDVVPSGLYLATNERSLRLYQDGLRIEGYLGQAGCPEDVVTALSRSPEVVEQCVNALCGSLLDFDDDGKPLLGPCVGGFDQNAQRRATQEGILAFQEQWHRYVTRAQGNWPDLTGTARHQLGRIMTAALKMPTAAEAGLFSTWQHEDNFGSASVTGLLPEDLLSAVPYLSPNDLDDLHMRDAFWPALLASADPALSAGVRARAAGHIESTVFEPSGEPFHTHLRFRTGDDRWHDGPRQRVRINHNGLSFARLNVEAADITDVSLAIPGRPALVRIDWIEAAVLAGGSPEYQLLRWDEPKDFAGLVFADCRWLGDNFVEFDFPYSAMWLPLAVRAGAPVTSTRVTIAFAMLPRSTSQLERRLPPAPRVARLSGRMREELKARGVRGVAVGAARVLQRQLLGRSDR
ncbi:hypothetical protein GCM10012275_51880 [Longimycelium tulufanense]|uniref:HAD family hydrolase n=1 Tax=Longimycelium tulufanense TaxID=907463 RepID=A0A8J3FYU0_9PSEU|nr:HAD family hydrolase [Longimycelium tulufanense]GGM74819.1 hypothetical protein GCM10012275_51880 [Longimycelium tulufanense]